MGRVLASVASVIFVFFTGVGITGAFAAQDLIILNETRYNWNVEIGNNNFPVGSLSVARVRFTNDDWPMLTGNSIDPVPMIPLMGDTEQKIYSVAETLRSQSYRYSLILERNRNIWSWTTAVLGFAAGLVFGLLSRLLRITKLQ